MPRQQVKLQVQPTGTESVDLIKDQLPKYIDQVIREDGKETLLANNELQLEFEETFPTTEVIIIGLTLLSQAAIEYWKYRLEKKLKEEYNVLRITIKIPKDD